MMPTHNRPVCCVCTKAASSSTIQQVGKVEVFGIMLPFISALGQPVPAGMILCQECFTVWIDSMRFCRGITVQDDSLESTNPVTLNGSNENGRNEDKQE